jgi:uncharacterized protein YifN (PemK superfamily)
MPIKEHPFPGTVLLCDFSNGFKVPEMDKRRPVVVISPKIAARPRLCTVVALSTSEPNPVMPYHCQIDIEPKLPDPWQSEGLWVKGDMINAVGFHRLDFFRLGKDKSGKRIYYYKPISKENIKSVRTCVLKALNMSSLTKHL